MAVLARSGVHDRILQNKGEDSQERIARPGFGGILRHLHYLSVEDGNHRLLAMLAFLSNTHESLENRSIRSLKCDRPPIVWLSFLGWLHARPRPRQRPRQGSRFSRVNRLVRGGGIRTHRASCAQRGGHRMIAVGQASLVVLGQQTTLKQS